MDGVTMMTYGPANRLYLAAVKTLAAVNGGLGELPDAELEELKGAIEKCETAIKDRTIYAAEIKGVREVYCSDEIEIDDDPVTSASDEGVWVSAWVWMPHKVSSD